MIKGLYFKLNLDKQIDERIYKFFMEESKRRGINKIDMLYNLIELYETNNAVHKRFVRCVKNNDFDDIFKDVEVKK